MAPEFLPARSKLEAAARIYNLAGATPEPLGPGSKERKSLLLKLAAALDLQIDAEQPKPAVGGKIAVAVGALWDGSCWSAGSTITLTGLNRLLHASTVALAEQARHPRPTLPGLLDGWNDFQPARSKLEAVNRISGLTGSGPQELGPGSKERKSVLADAAAVLEPSLSGRYTKTGLGEALAGRLGVRWDDTCWSTGETITLDGLNVILAGMERRLGRLGRDHFLDERQEAEALLGVLDQALPERWEGRECVLEMREAEYRNWRQLEWPGFYFEYKGLPALIDSFGGGPRTVGAVKFDYVLQTVWDLKCHSHQARGAAPLNDRASMEMALSAGPLGLLVLSGTRTVDPTGMFDAWHRAVTTTSDRPPRPANAGWRRQRKSAFDPTSLTAFVIRDTAHHDALLTAGVLQVMRQGRQAGGALRQSKYAIDISRARQSGVAVAYLNRDS